MTVKNWRSTRMESVQYITPDGVVFDLHDPPARSITSMTGWGHPPIESEVTRGPYQDGNTLMAVRILPRRIDMVIRHKGCDRSSFWSIRSQLIDALRVNRTDMNTPSLGTLRWTRNDGSVRAVNCLIDSDMPLARIDGSFSIQESLNFIAHNPNVYDPSSHVETLTGFNIATPKTATIIYSGTSISYPVIEITGPCDDITIENTTTGKLLYLNYTVAAAEVVTFDLAYDHKLIYNDSGDNLLGYLDISSSTLFEFGLQPDPIAASGSNPLEVDLPGADVNTKAVVTYYDWYIGI